MYGASRNEVATVRCSVDAHPGPSTGGELTFRWMFNSSLEVMEVANGSITTSGWQSNVTHRVQSEQDYGTLLCWARNSVGEQRDPCVFRIQPAGMSCSCFIIQRIPRIKGIECSCCWT